jgi:hypothetical protein
MQDSDKSILNKHRIQACKSFIESNSINKKNIKI